MEINPNRIEDETGQLKEIGRLVGGEFFEPEELIIVKSQQEVARVFQMPDGVRLRVPAAMFTNERLTLLGGKLVSVAFKLRNDEYVWRAGVVTVNEQRDPSVAIINNLRHGQKPISDLAARILRSHHAQQIATPKHDDAINSGETVHATTLVLAGVHDPHKVTHDYNNGGFGSFGAQNLAIPDGRGREFTPVFSHMKPENFTLGVFDVEDGSGVGVPDINPFMDSAAFMYVANDSGLTLTIAEIGERTKRMVG